MPTRRFGRYVVETSSEDKLLFPESGCSKGDLLDYYQNIGRVMVPHLTGRPLSMHRYPAGIHRQGFFQQKSDDYFPDWIERVTLPKQGGEITHAVCNNTATLVYLAQIGTITPHVWLSKTDALEKPDQIVFDLDPPEGGEFADVRRAAFDVRELLEETDLKAFVMTTGSSGLHVRAPIRRDHNFDDVRAYTRRLAERLSERHPDYLTVEQRKNKRRGRVYLDVMRIAYGQTAVPPYAVRARAGAPVAAPVTWDELESGEIGPRSFSMKAMLDRIEDQGDPWAGMFRHARSLSLTEDA